MTVFQVVLGSSSPEPTAQRLLGLLLLTLVLGELRGPDCQGLAFQSILNRCHGQCHGGLELLLRRIKLSGI